MEWQHRTGANDGACNAAAQEGKSYRRTTVQGGTVPGPTGEELARYLDRNGVPSEPITVQPESRSTGEAILAVRSRLVLE
jgi:uncharacterized SAM-binding protein YcdF (DUF218 family)